jgi:hypothetical protein
MLTADLPKNPGEWCVLGARTKAGGRKIPCCFSMCLPVFRNYRITVGAYPMTGAKLGWHCRVIKLEKIR